MNNRATLLKKSLLLFYSNKEHLDSVVNVVNRNTEYSLRILEWFCSNYSKKYNIIYKISKAKEFNVYTAYKSQLDSYQKKQFDPFKRDHKGYGKFNIKYETPDGNKMLETTVGQLNFFRWCIENKILDYVKKKISRIKNDMNDSINYPCQKDNKNKLPRKKRQPLSLSATRTCVKRYTTVVLNFE